MIRAYEEDGFVTFPVSSHEASVFANLMSCSCYVILNPGQVLKAGDPVRVRMMKSV